MRFPSRMAAAVVACLLAALLAPAAVAADRQARVVNGTEVASPDAPYMAFITFDGFACGGSLIHPSWVLTAGHCVSDGNAVYAPSEFRVAIGREDLNDGSDGENRTVSKVVRHPDYDPIFTNGTIAHDVALLRLTTPSTQPVIRLANAAQTSFELVGTDVIVQGYGLTSAGGSASKQLLETDLDVNTDASCEADDLGDGTMCAGDLQSGSGTANNDSCNGDSGGPLVHDDPVLGRRQVGTVSYGPIRCGYEEAGLDAGGYGRVSFFEDFIHDNVGIMAFVDDLSTTEGTSDTDTVFEIPVSLSRSPEGSDATTVSLSTTPGTATTSDFTSVTNQGVTFRGTDRATLPVQVTADAVNETSESFTVIAGTSSVIPVVRSAVVTILDDDGGLRDVDVTATNVVEGDTGTVTMTVTATLSAPAIGTETIRVTSDGGTATTDSDYLAFDEVMSFRATETTRTRELTVIGDLDDEGNESIAFAVELTTDVAPGGSTGTGTILDDDGAAPPRTVTATTTDVDEGDELDVVLTLDGPAAGGESVDVRVQSPAGSGRDAADDFDQIVDRVVFVAEQVTATATLATTDDTTVEPDEPFEIILTTSSVVNGSSGLTTTILDDDEDDEKDDEENEDGRPRDSAPTIVVTAEPVTEGEDVVDTDDVLRVIERRAGSDRIATALATSASRADGSTTRVYLASSTSYPDALVGTPLAHRDGAPLLLTPPDTLDGRVLEEMNRVLAPGGRVRLLGGPVALSPEVATALTRAGLTNDRLAGENRFQTATVVADELGDIDLVLLATGRNFPDALAAGAAAAATNGAVLLTDDRTLPAETAAFLDASAAAEAAVGGAAAAARPSATPLIGADRYATAALVAERYLADAPAIGLASGTNFPDALTGGVEIAALGGALLLTAPDQLSAPAADRIASSQPTTVLLFGGPSALDPAIESSVRALLR